MVGLRRALRYARFEKRTFARARSFLSKSRHWIRKTISARHRLKDRTESRRPSETERRYLANKITVTVVIPDDTQLYNTRVSKTQERVDTVKSTKILNLRKKQRPQTFFPGRRTAPNLPWPAALRTRKSVNISFDRDGGRTLTNRVNRVNARALFVLRTQ